MDGNRTRRVSPALAFGFVAALAIGSAVATAAFAASAFNASRLRETPGTWCGGTLWRLQNLSDPDRMRVNFEREPTTISEISRLAPPKRIAPARTTPFQRQRWGMRAVIDRFRIASNGEIILILYSIDSQQYMDAYLPNPHCLGARARDRSGMIAARREFLTQCSNVKVTAAWQLLGVTVDLAGVGYWNPSKVTRGALPSGAELRPLTNLKVVSGCGVG